MTEIGWMTEYRIAWYHQQGDITMTQQSITNMTQQGATTMTHQGLPYFTIKIGTPLPSERSQIYGIGCTHRAEVFCGSLWMILACNFNHDDEVLFNPYPLVARFGYQDVMWDTQHLKGNDQPLNLKLHRARDEGGNRFVDLYMYIWSEGQPMRVLIMAKKVVGGVRARLTNVERLRLGIPQIAWDTIGEAEPDPRDYYDFSNTEYTF